MKLSFKLFHPLVGPSLAILAALSASGQQRQKPGPPPGVPGVQAPMSNLIPDGQYNLGTGGPDWLAMTEDSVWTNSSGTDLVYRMDPRNNAILATVPVKRPCSGFAVAAGTLWAPSCGDHTISRIDLATNQVVATVPVGPANSEGGIAFGAGAAWMPSDSKTGTIVSRIDPATNKVSAEITVAPGSYTAVYGYNLVWVSSTEKSLVSVIHPATNRVIAEIPVDKNPRFMAAGEGYVWTLNQGTGTVTKIDPRTLKVVATIEVGVPGTGGDIATGEGAVWLSIRAMPVIRIDPASNKVTAQLTGPGGDAMRVGHGYVWLSNGRQHTVWRFLPEKVMAAAPHAWTDDARPFDLDGDGKPDILVEDLATFIPGQPATFHVKALNPKVATSLVLKTKLNAKAAETPFTAEGDRLTATLSATEPRWIHYSVCIAGSETCSPELVVASPTTNTLFATNKVRFVPESFMAPPPPAMPGYTWNILEPEILNQDYAALATLGGKAGPMKTTIDEDYGEVKRHRWEFQHQTSFAYGVLTADGSEEVACVYVNPSKKAGYEATVRVVVTAHGEQMNLLPTLQSAVKDWIKASFPFKTVAYPGLDIPMSDWNALADSD
jgi:virginiamycin B lyase